MCYFEKVMKMSNVTGHAKCPLPAYFVPNNAPLFHLKKFSGRLTVETEWQLNKYTAHKKQVSVNGCNDSF